MRAILFILTFAAAAAAQPAPAALTADQIIEKSIAATGGREALDKSTSIYTKAIMEVAATERHSVMEYWGKAPNKRLVVMNLEGYGEVKTGFDGRRGWTLDPVRGVRDITGAELVQMEKDAVFRPELKWRETYTKAELLGKRKLTAGGMAYVVRLSPKQGAAETRLYDAKTFLLAGIEAGSLKTEMSDYRDVGGVKMPFRIVQTTPAGEMVIRMVEAKSNPAIDDAIFTKPAK